MEAGTFGHNFERGPPQPNWLSGFREENLKFLIYNGCQEMAKAHMTFGQVS